MILDAHTYQHKIKKNVIGRKLFWQIAFNFYVDHNNTHQVLSHQLY